jgi:Clp amino terminal domain, pathogenicity island component/DinB superfamily
LFERFTEHARRSIFFARYEASMFGSTHISCEELLLGILREDKTLAMRVGVGALESVRKEITVLTPPRPKIATSVELPLSHDAKRALADAAEEADAMGHKHIDASHLMLGLMRNKDGLATQILQKHGVDYDQFREFVARGERTEPASVGAVLSARSAQLGPAPAPIAPLATRLEPVISNLQQLVDNTSSRLLAFAESYGDQRLKREPQPGKPWKRKEALGHLIDWAIVHRQWFTEALMEPKVKGARYPDQAEVHVQQFAKFPRAETVNLWASLNRLLIHLLLQIPEAKLDLPCRIGIAEPVTLAQLIDAYFKHCQDIAGQVLARLD